MRGTDELRGVRRFTRATLPGGNAERLGANHWHRQHQERASPTSPDRRAVGWRRAEENIEIGAVGETQRDKVRMHCGASQDGPRRGMRKEADEYVNIEVRLRRKMGVAGKGGVFMWLGRKLFVFGVMLNSMGCARANESNGR